MLHSTRGIFLHKINYSESSLIVKIYTEKFGLQSYMLKGAKRKKKQNTVNILQHLALLDMEVYHRPKSNLQKIKEYKLHKPFQSIPYRIQKSTLALFINELIMKTIGGEEAAPELFGFLYDEIDLLDRTDGSVADFHLNFMAKYSRLLGFSPLGNYSGDTPCFDMAEGIFSGHTPGHPYYLDESDSKAFSELINHDNSDLQKAQLTKNQRDRLLLKMIEYYRLHNPDMDEMKTLPVLRNLFS